MKSYGKKYKNLTFVYGSQPRVKRTWLGFFRAHIWQTLLVITLATNITMFTWTKNIVKANTHFTEVFQKQEEKITKVTQENQRVTALQSNSPKDIVAVGTIIHDIISTCDTGQQEKFLSEVLPHAIRFQIQKNVPASAMVAQAIYESGYGKSELAKQNYNYFGLKAPTDGSVPYSMMTTTDCGVSHLQPFRKFSSAYDGFCGYYNFLSSSDKNGRYDTAFKQHDGISFVSCLLKAGYCPNSNYLSDIRTIISRHHLDQLDKILVVETDSTAKTVTAPMTLAVNEYSKDNSR